MTRESVILRDVAYCLSHFSFFVIPQDTRAGGNGWSIWKEIDRYRYVGVIWRSNTGALRNKRGSLVRFGIPGLPDFQGWIFESGKRLSLEVKTDKGAMTIDQSAHLALAISTGNLAGVVRSYEDCEKLLIGFGLQKRVIP